jgi:hypothetical protein
MAKTLKLDGLSRTEIINYGVLMQKKMAHNRIRAMRNYYGWSKNKYGRELTVMNTELDVLSEDEYIILGNNFVAMRKKDRKHHQTRYSTDDAYRKKTILQMRKIKGISEKLPITEYSPHRKVAND